MSAVFPQLLRQYLASHVFCSFEAVQESLKLSAQIAAFLRVVEMYCLLTWPSQDHS